MQTTTLPSLPKAQIARLRKAALRYGFSPDELMRRIIADATQTLLAIPEESLDEYENSEEIKKSFYRALRDERKDKILRTLPKSITRVRR